MLIFRSIGQDRSATAQDIVLIFRSIRQDRTGPDRSSGPVPGYCYCCSHPLHPRVLTTMTTTTYQRRRQRQQLTNDDDDNNNNCMVCHYTLPPPFSLPSRAYCIVCPNCSCYCSRYCVDISQHRTRPVCYCSRYCVDISQHRTRPDRTEGPVLSLATATVALIHCIHVY